MKSFIPTTLLPISLWLLLVVATSNTYGAVSGCEPSIVDNCTHKLVIIGDENYYYPKQLTEMNKHCKDLKGLERCVKDYSAKCLDSQARQTISVLTYSITKTHKGFCSNSNRKNVFIALGRCITPNRKEFTSVMRTMSKDFQAITEYPDKAFRLPLVCCNFYKAKERILDVVTRRCPEHYGEAENLISGYANDVVNILCNDYTEESDKCQQIIDKTPKWKKPIKWKSFVMPLVEVINSLD